MVTTTTTIGVGGALGLNTRIRVTSRPRRVITKPAGVRLWHNKVPPALPEQAIPDVATGAAGAAGSAAARRGLTGNPGAISSPGYDVLVWELKLATVAVCLRHTQEPWLVPTEADKRLTFAKCPNLLG